MFRFVSRHSRCSARFWLPIVVLMFTMSNSAFTTLSLAQGSARVYCVSATSTPTSPPCFNTTAFPTIQQAVDAAASGDEIRIAAGIYTPGDFGPVVSVYRKGLQFAGGYAKDNWTIPGRSNLTIIDGENKGADFSITSDNDITIKNMIIRHGSANNNSGGGIYANVSIAAVLSLIDVVVTDNTATYGGGGIFGAANTIILRCQITNNVSTEDGGGIFGSSLFMSNSVVSHNTSYRDGGGIVAQKAVIVDSLIANNVATAGAGGGLNIDYVGADVALTMTRTHIVGNRAGGAAAVYLGAIGSASISWSLLDHNLATDGSNIVVNTSNKPHLYLQNDTLAGQSSPGEVGVVMGTLVPAPAATLSLINTVVTGFVSGIRGQKSLTLVGDYNAFFNNGTNLAVEGAPGMLPFTHLVIDDPVFVDAGKGDFHLTATSPLRDAGNPSLDYSHQQDPDTVGVPQGQQADIGAFEYLERPYQLFAPIILQTTS